jgi:phage FluMu protein Com
MNCLFCDKLLVSANINSHFVCLHPNVKIRHEIYNGKLSFIVYSVSFNKATYFMDFNLHSEIFTLVKYEPDSKSERVIIELGYLPLIFPEFAKDYCNKILALKVFL